jgi:hypothetical protein
MYTLGLIILGVLFGMLVTSLLSINHVNKMEEKIYETRQYLTTLLLAISPTTKPAFDLVMLCMQIDNYIVSLDEIRKDVEDIKSGA